MLRCHRNKQNEEGGALNPQSSNLNPNSPHEPEAVSLNHGHDDLLGGAVGIGNDEEDIGASGTVAHGGGFNFKARDAFMEGFLTCHIHLGAGTELLAVTARG